MTSVKKILADLTLPTGYGRIYTDGEAAGRVAEAQGELAKRVRLTLADPEIDHWEQVLKDASDRLHDSEVVFTFTALPDDEYEALLNAYPSPNPEYGYDVDKFPSALIAATAVDPELTVEEANEVRGKVSNAQWDVIFGAAMALQTKVPRPIYPAGSGSITGGGENSSTATTEE